MISFSRPFYYYYPSPFPGDYYIRSHYVVAPYWADHDIRRGGRVLYETFQRGQSRNDNNILNNVNRYLRVSNVSEDFTGTFMIMAKWENVRPYSYGSDRTFLNQVNML